jgi:glutamyl-tRNA(Gln) amidotransferase subunit D
MGELTGYRGPALRVLQEAQVSVGDLVRVETHRGTFEGYLMPRYSYADDRHVVIKLKSGYNIGLRVDEGLQVIRLAPGKAPAFTAPPRPEVDPQLPRVAIISTGGTIASRIDYRTGGVHPALSAEDLYSLVPELAEYARVDAEVLFSLYSENLLPEHWRAMAAKVEEKVRAGYRGVVLTHGTDTMGYTAAALSFALQGVPIPVVLVGAQRSSDRPSSDAATNLIGAVRVAATAPFSGVYVVMHAGLGDDLLAVHRGTKVRKNHTSRRDAFESVNERPVAYLRDGVLEPVAEGLPTRGAASDFMAKPDFEERVALVKFYPGFDPRILEHLLDLDYRGIVLEGTGLGHVSHRCFEALRKAQDQGVLVAMTSQCIWGRVRMTVYDTGRDLLALGVLPLGDMLPETAYVKMAWVLANTHTLDEARELMLRPLAGEINPRSPIEEV